MPCFEVLLLGKIVSVDLRLCCQKQCWGSHNGATDGTATASYRNDIKGCVVQFDSHY